jgi:serine/threonine-protein kinase
MIPRIIGRYKVKAKIAEGGMATIYRAHDPRTKRDVAIKMLPREFLHDRTFRTRFEREAEIIATLEHPAIVPMYDYGEDEEAGQPYFVMRYMPGGSLADRILKAPLPVAEAARIVARLAPALDTAHAKNIIHRDLKPANILFDQYGEPYISDFGIVKIAEHGTTLTGRAMTIGTPDYMSPEQASGEELDGRSDIYALGIMLFEMLAGELPYVADTPLGMAYKHVNEPLPRLLDKMPTLPTACQKVIERATAKRKDDRYPTVSAMAEALSAAARSAAEPARNTTALLPSVKPSKAKAAGKRAKSKASPARKSKTAQDKPARAGAAAPPHAVDTSAVTMPLEPGKEAAPPPGSALRSFIQKLGWRVAVVPFALFALCLILWAAGAVSARWLGARATSPVSSPTAEAVVRMENVHVRAGPGTVFDSVAVVSEGDELEVRGRNNDGTWLAVTLPNRQQGWISASTVDVSVDVQTLTVIRSLSP